MKLIDIKGRPCSINVGTSKDNPEFSRSELQDRVKHCLVEKYPHEIVLEEFTIPASRLKIDFFIPRLRIAIEVDGSQHGKYNAFYHGVRTDNKFSGQVKRDVAKDNWCEINNIKLIRINHEKELND